MCTLYILEIDDLFGLLEDYFEKPSQALRWDKTWVAPYTRPRMPILLANKSWASASWTLVPPWLKPGDHEALKKQSIMTANARSETMFDLPSFKHSARHYRCLVPATAFREWHSSQTGEQTMSQDSTNTNRSLGAKKVPYKIHLKNQTLFMMAGLYTQWQGEYTFTIITKPANKLMSFIHNGKTKKDGTPDPRMPALIPEEAWELWLGSQNREELLPLLEPNDKDGLEAEVFKNPPPSRAPRF